MRRPIMLALLLLALPWASAEAKAPDLQSTLSWLTEHLPKMGGKMEAKDDATNFLYIHPRFSLDDCTLTIVEWEFSGPASARKGTRQEMTLPLSRLSPTVLLSAKPKEHAQVRFQTADGKKSLDIYMEQKLGNQFTHRRGSTQSWRLLDKDEAHAQRVAKALEHVIRLCSELSEDDKTGDEPF